MFNRKGQGLSLNVIILAVLAIVILVLLVVLVVNYLGKTQVTIGDMPPSLALMQAKDYKDCHPNSVAEKAYADQYNSAPSDEGKQQADNDFLGKIAECGKYTVQEDCPASSCAWS
jgi:hypothetical protein